MIDIEALARQSGFKFEQWLTNPPKFAGCWTEREGLDRFAALIADEAAKLCEGAVEYAHEDDTERQAINIALMNRAAAIRSAFAVKGAT